MSCSKTTHVIISPDLHLLRSLRQNNDEADWCPSSTFNHITLKDGETQYSVREAVPTNADSSDRDHLIY